MGRIQQGSGKCFRYLLRTENELEKHIQARQTVARIDKIYSINALATQIFTGLVPDLSHAIQHEVDCVPLKRLATRSPHFSFLGTSMGMHFVFPVGWANSKKDMCDIFIILAASFQNRSPFSVGVFGVGAVFSSPSWSFIVMVVP